MMKRKPEQSVLFEESMTVPSLSFVNRWGLILLSFLIVAFGQPAWNWWGGLLAAMFGYALFWRALLTWERRTYRFYLAIVWYSAVQLVQLSWMAMHPYVYIYPVMLLCAAATGVQFALLSVLVTPSTLSRATRIVALACLWTVMEWMRLFLFSGFSWNPSGLALTGSIYSLQMASVWGVYGLSFWVMIVNLLALRAAISIQWVRPVATWSAMALIPYAFGIFHFHVHESSLRRGMLNPDSTISALLVQPAFPIEETVAFRDAESVLSFVMGEWEQILGIMKKQVGKHVDLIAFPEYVVPYGTYFLVFPYEKVVDTFRNTFGEEALAFLPPFEEPLAGNVDTPFGKVPMVSNAYWVQALANMFQSDIVVGLEDVVRTSPSEHMCYNAAFHFKPVSNQRERYEKRILIPMGEYMPFTFCQDLVSSYGIAGSFSPGKSAKVFQGKVPFGVAICYEETFGDMTRQNRGLGAELLVNLTSDVWYPNSRLPQQHFDHARLRTVESGVPLVRACNTGITGAVDSLGRVVKTLGEDPHSAEWLSEALYVDVPLYHYKTLYSYVGDGLIIGFSAVVLLLTLSFRNYEF